MKAGVILKLLILLVFLFPFPSEAQEEDMLLNPFKRDYGGLLDYRRFKNFQQFSFLSVSGSGPSRSLGLYMNTLQYNLRPGLEASLHLGKQFDFSGRESAFDLKRKEEYLAGGTLVYRAGKGFTAGIEYGDTPGSMDSFLPFMTQGLTPDKNMKVWMNKAFGRSELNLYLQYREFKPAETDGSQP